MKIIPVSPDLIPSVWEHVAKMLDKAVSQSPNLLDIGDVYMGALNKAYVVWVVIDDNKEMVAAITTRKIDYPKSCALAIEFVGGNRMSEWIDLALDTFEKHAKVNGCTTFEGYGRKAWGRVLEKRGWKPAYVTYKKEL